MKRERRKLLLIFFAIILGLSLLKTFTKGEVKVDADGNYEAILMNLSYKYKPEWERVPTDINTTLYVKDEEGNNKLLITLYAYPLNVVGATKETAYDDIAKLYSDEYETETGEETTIDGKKATTLYFYSKDNQFGGKIYIVVDGEVGYTIMFTEEMHEFEKVDNELNAEFLANLSFN